MITLPDYKCEWKYPVVTMGTFDGVHKGHQKLLTFVKKRAEEMGGEAVVLTYYHHPLEILNKITHPYLLTEKEKKESILKKYGIDCVIYLNFTEDMAKMKPEEFLKQILIDRIGAKEIVFGYDTHFGDKRRGGYEFLKSMEEKYKYKGDIISPLTVDDRLVSSSWIRDLIKRGEVKAVNELLGYEYSVFGKIVEGHKIGRTLGFPTINLKHLHSYKLVPKTGIYLTKVTYKEKLYFGVTNIGYSPTIKSTNMLEIETFLLDFSGDLYNEDLELTFIQRIRDEKKFDSVEELIRNIKLDVENARSLITKYLE